MTPGRRSGDYEVFPHPKGAAVIRVSHAQNAEDIMLHRLFGGRERGFYIDVGAGDPSLLSVTRLFYDQGWCGINVEPDPVRAEALTRARPRDLTVAAGLADAPGTRTFYEASLPDYSTFREEYAGIGRGNGITFRERPAPVTTLAEVCSRSAPEAIDFLTIDAEGSERRVILGGDWTRWRPRAVVVEAIRPGDWSRSDIGRVVPSHGEWEPLLLDAGYLFAHFDGLNRFYLRREDEDLLPRLGFPANPIVDGFVTAREDGLRSALESAAAERDEARREVEALRRELEALRIESESLRRDLARFRNLGPLALGAAFHLRAASLRFPAAAAALKRLLGRRAD